MTSQPSEETLRQLMPLLGSLSRLVAAGDELGDDEYDVLLLSLDLDLDATAAAELRRWGRLLHNLRSKPTNALRSATYEGLIARGLPEAAVLLALDTVRSGARTTVDRPTSALSGPSLRCTPDRLDFGVLALGQSASAELLVEGGPGQVMGSSEQIVVMPDRFGHEATVIKVLVQPGIGGVLWTSLKLATGQQTVEIPVVAQWLTDAPHDLPSATKPHASFSAVDSVAIILVASGDVAGLESAVTVAEPGDQIGLAPGTYALARPLTITRDVMLVGAGPDKTRLTGESGPCVIRVTGNTLFAADGITFHYQGSAWSHVAKVDGGNVTLNHCCFMGGKWDDRAEDGGCGLVVVGRTTGKISDCVFKENESDGINLDNEAELVIEHCHCFENGDSGIAYFGNTGGKSIHNECTGNSGHGVYLDENARPDLANNACRRNGVSGIGFFGRAGGRASDNRCEENGAAGIHLQDFAAPQLEHNTCVRNQEGGIAFLDQSGGQTTNNSCVRNDGYGIYVAVTAKPILLSNSCTGNRESNLRDERR